MNDQSNYNYDASYNQGPYGNTSRRDPFMEDEYGGQGPRANSLAGGINNFIKGKKKPSAGGGGFVDDDGEGEEKDVAMPDINDAKNLNLKQITHIRDRGRYGGFDTMDTAPIIPTFDTPLDSLNKKGSSNIQYRKAMTHQKKQQMSQIAKMKNQYQHNHNLLNPIGGGDGGYDAGPTQGPPGGPRSMSLASSQQRIPNNRFPPKHNPNFGPAGQQGPRSMSFNNNPNGMASNQGRPHVNHMPPMNNDPRAMSLQSGRLPPFAPKGGPMAMGGSRNGSFNNVQNPYGPGGPRNGSMNNMHNPMNGPPMNGPPRNGSMNNMQNPMAPGGPPRNGSLTNMNNPYGGPPRNGSLTNMNNPYGGPPRNGSLTNMQNPLNGPPRNGSLTNMNNPYGPGPAPGSRNGSFNNIQNPYGPGARNGSLTNVQNPMNGPPRNGSLTNMNNPVGGPRNMPQQPTQMGQSPLNGSMQHLGSSDSIGRNQGPRNGSSSSTNLLDSRKFSEQSNSRKELDLDKDVPPRPPSKSEFDTHSRTPSPKKESPSKSIEEIDQKANRNSSSYNSNRIRSPKGYQRSSLSNEVYKQSQEELRIPKSPTIEEEPKFFPREKKLAFENDGYLEDHDDFNPYQNKASLKRFAAKQQKKKPPVREMDEFNPYEKNSTDQSSDDLNASFRSNSKKNNYMAKLEASIDDSIGAMGLSRSSTVNSSVNKSHSTMSMNSTDSEHRESKGLAGGFFKKLGLKKKSSLSKEKRKSRRDSKIESKRDSKRSSSFIMLAPTEEKKNDNLGVDSFSQRMMRNSVLETSEPVDTRDTSYGHELYNLNDHKAELFSRPNKKQPEIIPEKEFDYGSHRNLEKVKEFDYGSNRNDDERYSDFNEPKEKFSDFNEPKDKFSEFNEPKEKVLDFTEPKEKVLDFTGPKENNHNPNGKYSDFNSTSEDYQKAKEPNYSELKTKNFGRVNSDGSIKAESRPNSFRASSNNKISSNDTLKIENNSAGILKVPDDLNESSFDESFRASLSGAFDDIDKKISREFSSESKKNISQELLAKAQVEGEYLKMNNQFKQYDLDENFKPEKQIHKPVESKETPVLSNRLNLSVEQLGILESNQSLINELQLMTNELTDSIQREVKLENDLRNYKLNINIPVENSDELIKEIREKSNSIAELMTLLNHERRQRNIAEEHVIMWERQNGQAQNSLDWDYQKSNMETELLTKQETINQQQQLIYQFDNEKLKLKKKYQKLEEEKLRLSETVVPDLTNEIEVLRNRDLNNNKKYQDVINSLRQENETLKYHAQDKSNNLVESQRDALRDALKSLKEQSVKDQRIANEKLAHMDDKVAKLTELNEKLQRKLLA